jgi:hypothetical protein
MPRLERGSVREFNLDKCLESTGHSEDLIRILVSEGVHSEKIHKTITRNTEHIKIIIGKQEVIDSASPRLVAFQEAVDLGEAFVAS